MWCICFRCLKQRRKSTHSGTLKSSRFPAEFQSLLSLKIRDLAHSQGLLGVQSVFILPLPTVLQDTLLCVSLLTWNSLSLSGGCFSLASSLYQKANPGFLSSLSSPSFKCTIKCGASYMVLCCPVLGLQLYFLGQPWCNLLPLLSNSHFLSY